MSLISKLTSLSAAGVSTGDYWIALLGGSSDDEFVSVDVDSNDDIICVGNTLSTGAGSRNALIAKYDTSGALLWSRTLGTTGSSQVAEAEGVAVDSSDNIYVCGYWTKVGQGNETFLAKYNSSGTIQWQKALGTSSAETFDAVIVDGNDKIYCVGDEYNSGYNNLIIASYSDDGTLRWDRRISVSSSQQYSEGIAVDSSNNVYTATLSSANYPSAGGSANSIVLSKWSATGSHQFSEAYGMSGMNNQGKSIFLDSSGNIYIVGYSNDSNWQATLLKLNSLGAVQWARHLGGADSEFFWGIVVDSSDDIIIAGYSNSTGTSGGYDIYVAKYTSSGTLSWQQLIGTTSNERAFDVTVDSNDDIYVVGNTAGDGAGSEDAFLLKLRGDGSSSGTFGSWTISNPSHTSSAKTYLHQSGVHSDTSYSSNDTTATLTDQSASLTEEKISI